MREKSFLYFCLFAIFPCLLLSTSCNKEETLLLYPPTLSVSSNSLIVSNDGGSYSFTYTVGNPADDGQVSCEADADWITGLDCSSTGTVRFSAEENPDGNPRTAYIVLTYSSSYGSISQSVAVGQDSNVIPVLKVQPTAVSVGIDGGIYSFDYTIENPYADGEISCSTSETWISDFDCSVSGNVSFSVDANSDKEIREGLIALYYVYGGGQQTMSETVSVVQDHKGGVGGGGGDVSTILGTYTAYGTVLGNGFDTETATSWELKIYSYTGTGDYDAWVDGAIPWGEGCYAIFGDHRYSAGIYVYADGTIHMPSQTNGTIMPASDANYYLGFTPCTGKDSGGYYYANGFPDLVFTYDDLTDTWESDNGLFMAGCKSDDISTISTFFQVVLPTITMTKTADTTSLDADIYSITHPITEGLHIFYNLSSNN